MQGLFKEEGRNNQSGQLGGPKRSRMQGLTRRRAVIIKVASWVALRIIKVDSWVALKETECKGYLRRRAVIVKVASWVALRETGCNEY